MSEHSKKLEPAKKDAANSGRKKAPEDPGYTTYRRDPYGVTPYYRRMFEYDEMRRNHAEPWSGFFG